MYVVGVREGKRARGIMCIHTCAHTRKHACMHTHTKVGLCYVLYAHAHIHNATTTHTLTGSTP